MFIISELTQHPIIPVITIDHLDDALPLAEALLKGGINVFEITLRTSCALASIKTLKAHLPDCIIAAGTILDTDQMLQVKDLGVDFALSPGITLTLIEAAQHCDLPFIPGVTTTSEVLAARELEQRYLKFFPAEIAGGTKMLKQFATLFPEMKFCPTGGLNEQNFLEYLQLPNVFAVGGSWLAPTQLVKAKDWQRITNNAKNALEKITA